MPTAYTQAQAANPNFVGNGLVQQTLADRIEFLATQVINEVGDPLGLWAALQTVLVAQVGM